jgi:hypothetical protein
MSIWRFLAKLALYKVKTQKRKKGDGELVPHYLFDGKTSLWQHWERIKFKPADGSKNKILSPIRLHEFKLYSFRSDNKAMTILRSDKNNVPILAILFEAKIGTKFEFCPTPAVTARASQSFP